MTLIALAGIAMVIVAATISLLVQPASATTAIAAAFARQVLKMNSIQYRIYTTGKVERVGLFEPTISAMCVDNDDPREGHHDLSQIPLVPLFLRLC